MVEWKKCSVCKKSIELNGPYHICSVTSCRKSLFCSVECWDVHNSVMVHKTASAIEQFAPSSLDDNENKPRRFIVSSGSSKDEKEKTPREILIVASKLKDYIRLKHEMNTSANVLEKLSDLVRDLADEACQKARADGRKTLMDRDF